MKQLLPHFGLAVLVMGLSGAEGAYAQTNRNLPMRNAGSTIPVAPRKTKPAPRKPVVTISQPTEKQRIQYETQRNLRQRGLPLIPNPQKPGQWREYYRASDDAKKKVLGPRYVPPTRKEQVIRGAGTGLDVINSGGRQPSRLRVVTPPVKKKQ